MALPCHVVGALELEHPEGPGHFVEAGFKATARALRQAIKVTGSGVPSTKGMLG